MHSSISSSSQRIPSIQYGSLGLGSVMLLMCMTGALEIAFRCMGHRPSVVDSRRLWAIHRADVYARGNRRRIVIAGASRAQLGVVPRVMEEQIPQYRVKQLTIDGTPSFEVVRDLCEDAKFREVIVWSATAFNLLPGADEGSKDVEYTRFFHEEFWRGQDVEKNLNCWIAAFLQDRLATMSSTLSLRSFLRSKLSPEVSYINLQINRYRPARYYEVMSDVEREEHRTKRIERVLAINGERLDEVEFVTFLKRDLLRLHELLLERGGRLVLVRMPTSDEHWKIDNRREPRELFWDQIQDITGIPTVHFADYPSLASFDCPDTSHLDAVDAPEFTRRLSVILKTVLEANENIQSDGNSAALHPRR